jgi:hypothetical protein
MISTAIMILLSAGALYVFAFEIPNIYRARTEAIAVYHARIVKELKWLSEQDDVTPAILEFSLVAAHLAGRPSTTILMLAVRSWPFRPRRESVASNDLKLASEKIRDSLGSLLFAFLKVVSLRSFTLGWMIFPLVLAEPRRKGVKAHAEIGAQGLILNRLSKSIATSY